jgi:hypothetical protein
VNIKQMIFAFGLIMGSMQSLGASDAETTQPTSSPQIASSNAALANHAVQIWFDSSSGTGLLYYATYDGTSWSAPTNNQIPLGSSSEVNGYTNAAYYPTSQQFVQVWVDYSSGTGVLYYATYDGTGWSVPTSTNQIPLGFSTEVDSFVAPVYNAATDTLVIEWIDYSSGMGLLYYATYDGTSWSVPTGTNQIPLGNSLQVAGALTPPFTFP